MSVKKKPLVVVTRKLPDSIETRMRELFDARLNLDDTPMTPEQIAEAARTADVLVPTVTDMLCSHEGRLRARRSDLINPVVRHCAGHAVPVSGCFRKVSPLGSPILASDFRQKIRAFWFLAFRPLYQKAGPRQEPLGLSQAGDGQSGAQGSGVFRA